MEPLVQFALVLGNLADFALLVFPMGGKSLFGNLVHAVAAYLHLYPSALLRHEGDVERLVAVGLRMVEPVAQTVGMRLVYLAYGHIDVEALVDFILALLWGEDDEHGQDVVDFIEGDVLVLHLVPDRVRALDTLLELILQPHLVEGITDGLGELVEEFVARLPGGCQLVLDGGILLGVLILETEVFELGLHPV